MKKFKGLLYKDLLQSKSVFVITVFISILFGAIFLSQILTTLNGYTDGDTVVSDFEAFQNSMLASSFYLPYLAFISCLVTLTNAELDEKCNFDKFIISSGLKREIIVQEKIICGFIYSIVPFITILICGFSLLIPQNPEVSILHSIFIIILSMSNFIMIIPLAELIVVFLGSYKAKQFGTLIALGVILLGMGVSILYFIFGLANHLFGALISLGYLIISLVLGFVFYKVALKKYKLKDF